MRIRMGEGMMNNSQFWTWTDHWQGWDWMREEQEAELELAEWADETLWMICLICGSPVEGCMCENIEDATPIPPLVRGAGAPLAVSPISWISRLSLHLLSQGATRGIQENPHFDDWTCGDLPSEFDLAHVEREINR